MTPKFSEKLIAYLTLLSGLSISAVAIYYSVVGLTAIFAAAVIPIIVMGVILEVSKLVATVWLKQNWHIAPKSIKAYLITSISVLMLITSLGIFGFLSKAHSDQSLVSGDVAAKISIIEEKIRISKENIDVNRRALRQMDEAVDQTMGRSSDEKGAEKAVQIRRAQARERTRLQQELEAEQKKISALVEEKAPLDAQNREVEAKVGPLKYIAALVYGETNETILEKAVTWLIIIIVLVFDPLALVLLLASQFSFQNFRERAQTESQHNDDKLTDIPSVQDKELAEDDSPVGPEPVIDDQATTVVDSDPLVDDKPSEDFDISKHPYLFKKPTRYYPPGVDPVGPQVYREEEKTPDKNENRIESLVRQIEENVELLEDYYQKNKDQNLNSDKLFDWSKIPPNTEYVDVNGEKMSVKVALEKFPINQNIRKER